MKTGRDLKDLLAEVIRQDEAKHDYLAPTRATELVVQNDKPIATFGDKAFDLNATCHGQIAELAKVPAAYYNRMLADSPDLLVTNINTWFKRFPPENVRMWRTLDGTARANLSDRFRCLDNNDLLQAALPRLLDMGVKVMSCQVTETKLYLKVVDERIQRDLPTGAELGKGHVRFDTVCPALVLSNSEVGMGRLSVLTSVWTGGCTNLAVINERSKRTSHIGGKHELGDDEYAMLSNTTKKLTDAALWSQVGDLVAGAFDRARFDATCDKIAATAENKIEADPIKVVEVTARKFGFTEGERNGVLRHLLTAGDMSQYGLHAAITRTAEDLENYDRASEFEALGGKVIELPRGEWKAIANAVEKIAA